jgi:D-psicose/D-tagatose/L-ribulose 3-epimerase
MVAMARRIAACASVLGLCAVVVTVGAAAPTGPQAHARVEIGVCTSLKNVAAAKAAGFDYVELGTTEIAALSAADFERALVEVKAVGLPVPVTNLFLPATIKVTGPTIDVNAQMAYVAKAFDRLQRLGVATVVFGSGGARRIPDGFPKEDAFLQLVEFGRRIAPEAARRGITIAIEPLRRQESNIINSAAEGLALVDAIGHPNFQLMIDFFHLSTEQEDPAVVSRAGARLRHLHMANPQGRVYPRSWAEFNYAPFFDVLRTTGYARRMSIEGTAADFAADAPPAIALLRRAFEAQP